MSTDFNDRSETFSGEHGINLESNHLEKESQRQNLSLEDYTLPDKYNDNRMVLQVRDPYWLYVYWDIEEELIETLKGKIGPDTFSNFYPLLRVYDVTEFDIGESSTLDYFDIQVHQNDTKWYINVDKPNHSYRVDFGVYAEGYDFTTIVRSNKVMTPRAGASDVIDEEWLIVEEEYKKLYRLTAGYGIGDSSIEITESLMQRQLREMGSGAISSISSPMVKPGMERPFWLNVNTELVVYGATEPDAIVTIQGKPVTLRPDGTFTFRYALPDGIKTIPVKARSADGTHHYSITPIVKKETE